MAVISNGPGLASQGDMGEEEERRPRLQWDLTERAIGVFFDVYNELGPGFPEFVCRRALVMGLRDAALDVREEVPLPVWFRGNRLITFRADIMIASGPVLIEVKAVPALEPHHIAQVLTYLKATEVEVALLVNFGKRPQFKRLVFQNERKKALPESRLEDLGTEMRGDLRSSEPPAVP